MSFPIGEEALYYFDKKGLLVFTEKYHVDRGFCCQNGCKHCPYGFEKENVSKQKTTDLDSPKLT